MKELLDTDRVNFLIWRYLLESNYRETAAKLQKEWRVHQPHRQFDFAPHVNTYALVSLLNKGLIYEDYQRQFAESQQKAPHDVPATAEATARGVFGPLKYQPDVADEEEDEEESEPEPEPEADEIENPRKRAVERQHHHELSHGSPAKRPRLSNGYENGADSATTPMEIDHHQHHQPDNHHAYPSPLEGEQAESPLLRTEGPSRGTQVEKVRDLTHGTVFLRLGADDSPEPGENPIVLLCEWNPRDPSILATAGTDALARIWTLPCGTTPPDAEPGHVDPSSRSFMNIADEDLPKTAIVSAMAWNSNGELIALGTELGNKSRVSIWSVAGTTMHRFDGLDSPVTNLCWNPNNNFLLAISPDISNGLGNTGTLIHISSPSMVNSMSRVIDHDLRSDGLDATWINESEFLLCGGDLLASFRCTEQGIVPGREFPTGKDERFTLVEFDWRSKLVATASDKGYIDIWDESGKRRSIPAHDGGITSIRWQPLQAEPAEDERLLVSGGEDGAILFWNVRNPENKPKYSIAMPPPLAVNSLSLTPDGTHVAVATHDRILVWKLGEHTLPKASWVPQPGWQTPNSNTDTEDAIPCLGWDSEGQRLVYGSENKLAVINFAR